MKKIILADKAGFCFGVKRAMNIAWDTLEKKDDKSIYALGPLIHNKQAVSKYEENGLITINEMNEVKNEKMEIIIRSHGVSKKIYEEAENKNFDIVDTTCPFVKKIHEIVSKEHKENKQIIVLGDKNHPEVIGINGWCEDTALIVKTFDEVERIVFDTNKEYIVVAQTTMNEKEFEKIIDYINSLKLNISIQNTICSATRVRQQAARELAEKVDVMVVVGGKHSSNTQKLVSICSEIVDTFAIETYEELKDINFQAYETVGITAGASTPDWIIEETIKYLREIGSDFDGKR